MPSFTSSLTLHASPASGLEACKFGVLTNNISLKERNNLFPTFSLEGKGATSVETTVAGESQKFKPIQCASFITVNGRLL